MKGGQIVKNTGFLYIRMIIMLLISLYTSRVVLRALGVEDFGVYNVINGLVVMFSLLNFGSASQRYISYSIGNPSRVSVEKVYCTFNLINIVIILLCIIIGETIGLWYINNKLVVPPGQINEAKIVYQFALFSFFILLYTSTASSAIISYEKMSAFAYISIFEALLKLVVAILISICPENQLVIYAAFMMLAQIITRSIYVIYTYKVFRLPIFEISYNKKFIHEVLGYTGWTCLVSIGVILANQGQNLLLNFYGGPILNTARGIAIQVQGAVSSFVQNFMSAISPQIVKKWSQNQIFEVEKLYIFSSKIAFLLMVFLIAPLIVKTDYILFLWLGEVPVYASIFLKLTLAWSIISALSYPNLLVVQASGKIRKYQLAQLLLLCPIFIGSWYLLRKGFLPQSIFVLSLVVECLLLYVRVVIVAPLIKMKKMLYLKDIALKSIIVGAVVLSTTIIISKYIHDNISSIISLYVICLAEVAILGYWIFCNSHDRIIILDIIRQKILKWKI